MQLARRKRAKKRHQSEWHPKDDLSYNSKRFLSAAGRGTEFGLVGDITDWIPDTARRQTRVLAWSLETDFCGSQLLIHKLVTGAIADTAITVISAAIASGVATAVTAIVTTITAAITAITSAITAIAAAVTGAITAAIDTARRRRRRSIDLATRRRSNLAARRRRRNIDLAARRRWRRSIRDGTRGNDRSTRDGEVGCFGLGRNGGGSEREGRREHDGYPA
jgi:hypothetical protein